MKKQLFTILLNTPLGTMQAIADNQALCLLEFIDNQRLDSKTAKLLLMAQATLVQQSNPLLEHLRAELGRYFQGSLHAFTTPVAFYGSSFQQRVWQKLCDIEYGSKQSYAHLASSIQMPSGFRAVAQANASNRLAIIIPCHRIIAKDGAIGGYSGGVHRKEWLLRHEQTWCSV